MIKAVTSAPGKLYTGVREKYADFSESAAQSRLKSATEQLEKAALIKEGTEQNTKKILGEVAKVRVNIAEEGARAEAARLLKENENGKTQLLINEREQKLAATKESLKQLESQKKANLVSLSELRNPTLHTFKKGVSSAKSSAMSGVKGMFNSINSSLPYKLVFLFLFVFVFYKVIYRICIFFGIDIVILNMYLGWVSFLLVLFTFLPHEYGNILDSADVPASPV